MPIPPDGQTPQADTTETVTEESLRQIQLIVEESHDAIIGKTLDGIITSWNGGATKMFGYSPYEVIGKPMANLFPPELRNELPRLLEQVRHGQIIADYDSVWLRKDGSRADVEFSLSPVHTENGEVTGVSLVGRDISERKKSEQAMAQIQLIVENSHDAIIGETLDGIITSWNGGATKMFGYSTQEAIGKSVLFLFPPELRREVPALLDRIKAGEVISDYDSVRLRKDGTKIDVALSISPIQAADGTVTGVSIVKRDITARKKAEQAMRQIQLIVENSHDAIIGITLDGTVSSWNGGAATMFGYSRIETVGGSIARLFPPELQGELPQLLLRVKRGESIADYESVWLRKDGARTDVEFSVSPIRADIGVVIGATVLKKDGSSAEVEFSVSPVHADGGEIIGASLVGRDITDRKKSERHIKELNEMRNKFIAIISHQMRTPLTALNWNLETLLNGDFGKLDDTQHKFLHVTHQASLEITHRIHSLLMAMDVEEGRVRYDTGEVVLESLCAGVVNEVRTRCESKSISCTYTPPGNDFPTIDADGEKIRMVITSLMENAIDYTKDGGKITATLRREGRAVRFEVADTGVGIPEAEQHRIFTRFFRASNASTMRTDAFGLGLFIAKSFIEQHHGQIGFESKEGEGSMFWFELPLQK